MPLHELTRRDSWPPTQVHLSTTDQETLRAEMRTPIDENPFAFFLTSPDDIDIDDYLSDEDLSAGIETPDSSRSPVREVSPSALQRNPLPLNSNSDDDDDIHEDDDEDDYEFGFGLAIPLSLKDFTNSSTSGRKSRTGNRNNNNNKSKSKEQELYGLGITLPEFSARGRAKVRLVPARTTSRGNGNGRMSRSLSARRPLSWRAPSPEIFSIREERESDEEEKEKDKGLGLSPRIDEDVYSVSAPASSRIGGGMGGIMTSPGSREKKKEKKRVHWAL